MPRRNAGIELLSRLHKFLAVSFFKALISQYISDKSRQVNIGKTLLVIKFAPSSLALSYYVDKLAYCHAVMMVLHYLSSQGSFVSIKKTSATERYFVCLT